MSAFSTCMLFGGIPKGHLQKARPKCEHCTHITRELHFTLIFDKTMFTHGTHISKQCICIAWSSITSTLHAYVTSPTCMFIRHVPLLKQPSPAIAGLSDSQQPWPYQSLMIGCGIRSLAHGLMACTRLAGFTGGTTITGRVLRPLRPLRPWLCLRGHLPIWTVRCCRCPLPQPQGRQVPA